MYDPKGRSSEAEKRSVVGDGGVGWRMRALKRMKERSREENRSLREIAEERGLSLEQLAQESSRSSEKQRFRGPHRSYLDDVRSERSKMRRPRFEGSGFARKETKRNVSETKRETDTSASIYNKFPNDGSFLQMASKMLAGDSEVSKDAPKNEKEETNAGLDNASIADQLRKQLQSGKPLETTHLRAGKGKALEYSHLKSAARHEVHLRVDGSKGNQKRSHFKKRFRNEDEDDIDKTLAQNISRKRNFNFREDLDADNEYDYDVGIDLFSKKAKKHSKHRNSKSKRPMQTLQDRCRFCFESGHIPKHLILSIGTAAYLRVPDSGALNSDHCMIVPLEHIPSTRETEENTWTEIRNFKKAFIQMQNQQNRDVIFLETALNLKDHERHAWIECIPVEHIVFEKAPIYFKKAIDDATADWSQHHAKRCIETGNRGLRGSIPERFPYFHVEFNLSNGFVHVIDDETEFDPLLGRRVLISLLGRPAEDMFKKTEQESMEAQNRQVHRFLEKWHPFDWTLQL